MLDSLKQALFLLPPDLRPHAVDGQGPATSLRHAKDLERREGMHALRVAIGRRARERGARAARRFCEAPRSAAGGPFELLAECVRDRSRAVVHLVVVIETPLSNRDTSSAHHYTYFKRVAREKKEKSVRNFTNFWEEISHH